MKSLQWHPPKEHEEMMLESTMPPKEPIFPSFCVDKKQMPEIEEWEVGGEYELKVKIRVRMKRAHADLKGSDVESDIEVLAYEVA